ncbi:MAG: hypothetical protein VKO64_03375 [Candidatus Sericytochromatia bacterium]|nr:hypothetical protein [Candidatus Sericytochromatia bacterium]
MLLDVLAWVARREGARMTEIRSAFGLSPWMAGALVVQLQDAGWLEDPVLGTCHHLGPDADAGSCGNCSGGGCSSQRSVTDDHGALLGTEMAFEQGCCGMNQPYRVTAAGRSVLETATPTPADEARSERPTAEHVAAAWVARAQARSRLDRPGS